MPTMQHWGRLALTVLQLSVLVMTANLASAADAAMPVTPTATPADKLSLEEFKAIQLLLIEQQFAVLDTNQDGYLDANERSEGLLRLQRQLQTKASAP